MPKISNLKLDAVWQEISATNAGWDKADQQSLLRMLNQMHLIRAFEEQMLKLDTEGLAHGPVHVSVGQEGACVAAMSVLGSNDQISYNPLGGTVPEPVADLVYRTMAEIMGLTPGFCKGRGGSMHLRWQEAGVIGTNAIVGGGVPLANGAAWACKRRGKGEVVFTFFGDGSVTCLNH